MASTKIILASTSPQRLSLLKQIGIEPEVIPANIDETQKPKEKPSELAYRLAYEKAKFIFEKAPANSIVIAGDTVVACGTRVLDKPLTEEQAYSHLSLLSGRRHRVYGGICVITPTKTIRKIVCTTVAFKKFSNDDIKKLIKLKEWQGRSGGYAISGASAMFVKKINGSYSNVVGLDLYTINNILSGIGYKN